MLQIVEQTRLTSMPLNTLPESNNKSLKNKTKFEKNTNS